MINRIHLRTPEEHGRALPFRSTPVHMEGYRRQPNLGSSELPDLPGLEADLTPPQALPAEPVDPHKNRIHLTTPDEQGKPLPTLFGSVPVKFVLGGKSGLDSLAQPVLASRQRNSNSGSAFTPSPAQNNQPKPQASFGEVPEYYPLKKIFSIDEAKYPALKNVIQSDSNKPPASRLPHSQVQTSPNLEDAFMFPVSERNELSLAGNGASRAEFFGNSGLLEYIGFVGDPGDHLLFIDEQYNPQRGPKIVGAVQPQGEEARFTLEYAQQPKSAGNRITSGRKTINLRQLLDYTQSSDARILSECMPQLDGLEDFKEGAKLREQLRELMLSLDETGTRANIHDSDDRDVRRQQRVLARVVGKRAVRHRQGGPAKPQKRTRGNPLPRTRNMSSPSSRRVNRKAKREARKARQAQPAANSGVSQTGTLQRRSPINNRRPADATGPYPDGWKHK